MNNDYRSPAFKKWLDKLQQESWQLELIISGFAIYALILAYEPIIIQLSRASSTESPVAAAIWSIVIISWAIFIFNLTLHLILRALWIGALGLRYVSGDIDYEKLNYSEKFTKYLRKKIGSFDRYIARLENYCSVLFAISFLVFFYILGFFLIIFSFIGVGELFSEIPIFSEITRKWIRKSYAWTALFLSLIVFIDFIGRGILKKKKWTSKIFFPIYWVFSFLTLSFLYRPLVYNFLDNKFGRKLSLILLPFYILIICLSSITYIDSNYLSFTNESSENFAKSLHYDDLLTEKTAFSETASIPSKIITTSYLKIFLMYSEKMENDFIKANAKLKPAKDLRGYKSTLLQIENFDNNEKIKKLTHNYLNTLNKIYNLKIDSILYHSDFIISTNDKEKLGFETYLNIRDLSEGKHILRILSPPLDSTKTTQDTLVTIPFWHYKK